MYIHLHLYFFCGHFSRRKCNGRHPSDCNIERRKGRHWCRFACAACKNQRRGGCGTYLYRGRGVRIQYLDTAVLRGKSLGLGGGNERCVCWLSIALSSSTRYRQVNCTHPPIHFWFDLSEGGGKGKRPLPTGLRADGDTYHPKYAAA